MNLILNRAPPTRQKVREWIDDFYNHAKTDALLGPIFSSAIRPDNWAHHLETMVDFWLTVGFRAARFDGDPLTKHARIAALTKTHYTRWLEIFAAILPRHWDEAISQHLLRLASRIGDSLQLGAERLQSRAAFVESSS